jgi:hypothetical protein
VVVGNLTVSTGFLQSTSNANITLDPNGTGIVSVFGNIVGTGSIVAGGVRSTTSATAPANPTVGDIWYNSSTDVMYRWTTDGTSSFWLDYEGPAFTGPQNVTKVANFVNAGTFVVLDNIKATVTTSGQRGLSLATVSGTTTCYISGTYGMYGGSTVGGYSAGFSMTTTPSASIFSWSFGSEGDTATYILNYGYSKSYRIIVMIGGSYNNNMISIERLI